VEKTDDNKGNLLNCSIKVKVTTTDRYDAKTTYKNNLKIKFNLLWKDKKQKTKQKKKHFTHPY